MVRRTLRPKGVWCKRKVPIVTIPYLFAEIKEIVMVNRSDFRFFSKHAGGWVGHNAITAFSLAKAEQYAEDMGWQYTWEWDE
jgi:hypothetical protein